MVITHFIYDDIKSFVWPQKGQYCYLYHGCVPDNLCYDNNHIMNMKGTLHLIFVAQISLS